MNHFPAAQINAYMGSAACVVGALEENQVTGTGLRCGNDGTLATPVLGGLPAKMEPGTTVIDRIGNKAGTVKAAGTVHAPDIGRSEILLCFGNKLCCLAGGFSINGIQNASNIQIKIGIEAGIPIAERKRHFACAANLGNDLSGRPSCRRPLMGMLDNGRGMGFHTYMGTIHLHKRQRLPAPILSRTERSGGILHELVDRERRKAADVTGNIT